MDSKIIINIAKRELDRARSIEIMKVKLRPSHLAIIKMIGLMGGEANRKLIDSFIYKTDVIVPELVKLGIIEKMKRPSATNPSKMIFTELGTLIYILIPNRPTKEEV